MMLNWKKMVLGHHARVWLHQLDQDNWTTNEAQIDARADSGELIVAGFGTLLPLVTRKANYNAICHGHYVYPVEKPPLGQIQVVSTEEAMLEFERWCDLARQHFDVREIAL